MDFLSAGMRGAGGFFFAAGRAAALAGDLFFSFGAGALAGGVFAFGGGDAGAAFAFAFGAGALAALVPLSVQLRRGTGLGGHAPPKPLRLLFLERVGRKQRHADSGKNPLIALFACGVARSALRWRGLALPL